MIPKIVSRFLFMHTLTLTDQTIHTITSEGKKNVVLTQLTSGGGNGDDSPPTSEEGNTDWGSNGGAGGATLSGIPIPDEDLTHDIVITLSQDSSTSIQIGSKLIELSPGEAGNTHSNTDDQAEAGHILTDSSDWITDSGTQYAPGAPGLSWESFPGEESSLGLGGASAGGIGGVVGISNDEENPGGAPTAEVGGGGEGGSPDTNGSPGVYPGGGGGGAGAGNATGGVGAGAKAILDYDDLDISITSNGGGATAEIEIETSQTFVTTLTADDDPDFPGHAWRIEGGENGDLLAITGDDLDELVFNDPVSPGEYEVVVAAYKGSTVVTQTITVTVVEVDEGTPPTITSANDPVVVENHTYVTTVQASGDTPIVYSIVGGADQAKFSINSSTGDLIFISAPDFETPGDADEDNVYSVTVRATNATGHEDQAIDAGVVNSTLDDGGGGSQAPITHAPAFANSDLANYIYNMKRENLL